ncbi:hypothetical protein [Leisingera sp. NJS204]|uniref:hypothetical protein n=1 Tax=Leisingera sp. NJS204 TaxID=2508307 RepID=UPI0010119D65|nr:hypothetical protein [Leisingera sp. NJS204]QAX31295.1 hypothetical protein ETW24_18990 [Leisingera sp. NJS204]
MSRPEQIRCAVSFKAASGIDCRTVLLNGTPPDALWASEARAALYRQHDVAGASITNIRVFSDDDREADFNVCEPEEFEKVA